MDILIFLVRLLFSALLYVFLGEVFFLLRRDIKTAARHQIAPAVRERPGQLRVLRGNNGFNEGMLLTLNAVSGTSSPDLDNRSGIDVDVTPIPGIVSILSQRNARAPVRAPLVSIRF